MIYGDIDLAPFTIRDATFTIEVGIRDVAVYDDLRVAEQSREVIMLVSPRFPLKRGTPVHMVIGGYPFDGVVRFRRLTKGVIDGRFSESEA